MVNKVPGLNGFLGEGTFFEGDLTFPDTLRIEGSFRGRICSPDATLIIAETGKVEADVEVAELLVEGHLSGTARASRRLEISQRGKLQGEVWSTNVVVRDGALLQGQCHMDPMTEKERRQLEKARASGKAGGGEADASPEAEAPAGAAASASDEPAKPGGEESAADDNAEGGGYNEKPDDPKSGADD